MSIFKPLGDAVGSLPKVATSIGTSISDTVASATNYVSTNFSLPNLSQKAAELGDKLVKTGTAGLFGSAVVKPGALDSSVATALSQATLTANDPGVPAQLIPMNDSDTRSKKVIIKQKPHVGAENELVLDVMPRIDERGGADYEAIQPLHHPGVIQKYRGTQARSWSVSGKLISRTVDEATRNLVLLNMIRSWRMPFYGEGTSQNQQLNQYLGAPPPILELSAYGEGMIGPVACVLKDYNWSFDNALDYIPTRDGVAFPVILEISLSLEESWSPAEFSSFDLFAYKQGKMMGGAFTSGQSIREETQQPAIPTSQTEETTLATGDFARLDRSQLAEGIPTPPVPVPGDIYHGGTSGTGGALAGNEEAGGNTLTF